MPKAPIWETALGVLSAEEYYSNARSTHYEFRAGTGSTMVIYPHELDDLENLVKAIKAHRNRPRLVLEERRKA